MWPASGPRFRSLHKHAEGGLGEIYVAHDEELAREVALKEIKNRFADHRESRARFQFEAEVTGGLEHPGIVPVYGLGYYPDGRPYYAMRFIRGNSLRDAIKQHHAARGRDPGRDALERHGLLRKFVDICNAMAYAHSRQVIHRDLKPDNVMLGPFGETLVVDWGLAKPLDRPDLASPLAPAEKPLRPASSGSMTATIAGATVGTPAYMPPEQAAGQLDRMGPASDIYSLGAILYSILTGRPPLVDRELGTVLHKVRHGEFPHPRRLDPAIPRALEAICLKAMALQPEDRYPTARALAADVEHWLADEPVSVYREPWTARLARWGRRHKTAVTGVAALLMTAVVALAAGNYLIGLEKARTERNYRHARAAVEQMLTEVGAVELADVPQMEAVRRRLLERALAFYLVFLQERGNEAALRQDTAAAHVRLADIQEMLGDYDAAEAQYRRALELAATLAAEAPGRDEPQRELATAAHNFGVLLKKASRFREAEDQLRTALRLRERLAAAAPAGADDRQRLADTRYFLGALLAHQGGRKGEDAALYAQALKEQEQLVAAQPDQPESRGKQARHLNNVGILLWASGRLEEAQQRFRQAEAIQQELTKLQPATPGFRWQLARTESNLGNLLQDSDQLQLAEAIFRRALEHQEKLADDYPRVPDYRNELGVIDSNLGLLLTSAGRVPEAEAAFRRALDLQRKLVADHPRLPDYRKKLALSCLNLAILLEATDPAAALPLYSEAIALQQRLVDRYRDGPEFRGDLGRSLCFLAKFHLARNDADQALPLLQRAIAEHTTARDADGRNRSYREYLRDDHGLLAVALLQKGDHAGAAAAAGELPRLLPDDPLEALRAAALLAQCSTLAAQDARLPEAKRKETSEGLARRAVQGLQRASERGLLGNPRDLDQPEFEPLRARPDFQAIRQDLEARATSRTG